MKRQLIGATLSTALLFIAPASAAPQPEPTPGFSVADIPPLKPGQEQAIENDFNSLRDYWSATKPGVAAVRLAIITGNETINCGTMNEPSIVRATNYGALQYCAIPNTVILSQGGISILNTMAEVEKLPADATMQIVLAHEIGHAVQNNEGNGSIGKSDDEKRWIERDADCLGGVAIHHTFPAAEASIAAFNQAISPYPDNIHDIGYIRTLSFKKGIETGSCYN